MVFRYLRYYSSNMNENLRKHIYMVIILSPVLGTSSARSIPLNLEKNLKLYCGNNTFNVKKII